MSNLSTLLQVYLGTLSTGQLIAIKRAQEESMQGGLEFKTEIEPGDWSSDVCSSDLCFSFEELKKYTNKFSEENSIGSGGYGKV